MARPIKYPNGFFEEDFKKHYRQKGQQRFGLRLLSMIFLQEGKTFEESARLLHKTVKTLRLWFGRYSSGGIEALLCLSCGRGRKDRLSKKDQEELLHLIDERQHNRQGGRWRGVDIQVLIKEMYGVDYTLSGVYNLAHRIGLSWITSRSVHPQADLPAQESFKKRICPKSKSSVTFKH